MAIYYINVQIIGRSAGRTATGAAAYRAGERILDDRTGRVFDYTRRQGEIESQILTPPGAPDWAHDRAELWNHVEAVEKRADAQVAREIVVAFPQELTPDQQRELIREYVQSQFVSRGMAVDVAIHRNPGNPHAHIMLTMRELGEDGFSPKKNREWNKPEALERWREEWANQANRELERAGREERIDHRSLAEQGLDRLPQVHLGPHAAALEREGIPTEKGEHNRVVAEHNAVVIELEKVREERQALEVERVTEERYSARIQAEWRPEHAQALEQLEIGAGGREVTYDQVRERHLETSRSLDAVYKQINEINREGQDMETVHRVWANYQEALDHLRERTTPLAALKRLFSAEAREEYRQARDRVEYTRDTTGRWGINTEADLNQRADRWEHRKAQVPGLETQADGLRSLLGVLGQAMDGFARAAERRRHAIEREKDAHERTILRQLQEEIERKRQRGMDRGR